MWSKLSFLAKCFLFAGLILTTGCSILTHHSDPLAGWKLERHEPDQLIKKDYSEYIATLPTEVRLSAGPVTFLSDGANQHAIQFETGANGKSWAHVLIYDKNDKRIKVIKYFKGYYAS